ncbi:hypothetical protein TNCT_161651 [Trichonephila clavata]|uniref:Uncharacterized protein n=1 Tax=Trichonephila clavata TaxID=2740835 RepID=A0A8X6KUG1_TRICU|nr:hypothetical protein TNCT_161651 [Trichonephila clavata]
MQMLFAAHKAYEWILRLVIAKEASNTCKCHFNHGNATICFHTYTQKPLSGQKRRSITCSNGTDLNFTSVDLFIGWWVEARIRLPFFPASPSRL